MSNVPNSNAPLVVSDRPTVDKKQRSQSWDNNTQAPHQAPNDHQYGNPAMTMGPYAPVYTTIPPVLPQLQHAWPPNVAYPQSGYLPFGPGAFAGGHAPVPYQNYQTYTPSVYLDSYRFLPQQTMNPGLGMNMNGHFSVPTSPTYPPHMLNQSLVAPITGKIRKDKPKDSSGLPRGPPRKPRQSGHAIWVGSLPADTSVLLLKDHFAEGFKNEIESVFVILKSNCAFINYTTEVVCREAVKKFHGSTFDSAVLSCRIQKSPAEATQEEAQVGEPGGNVPIVSRNESPSELSPTVSTDSSSFSKAATELEDDQKTMAEEEEEEEEKQGEDRFFIIKSLSIQDLVLSVRYGLWTTQSHNEEVLNNAFKTAKNVFLIFSANKSREYFGYARMISPVSEDNSSVLNSIKVDKVAKDTPKEQSTPATEVAPAGKVFEDAFRGTLFWESDLNRPSPDESTVSSSPGQGDVRFGGKPFGVAWMSTIRVPFTRTRGLRNAWNHNKEIKVARDGTELEPVVGKQLLGLFHAVKRSN